MFNTMNRRIYFFFVSFVRNSHSSVCMRDLNKPLVAVFLLLFSSHFVLCEESTSFSLLVFFLATTWFACIAAIVAGDDVIVVAIVVVVAPTTTAAIWYTLLYRKGISTLCHWIVICILVFLLGRLLITLPFAIHFCIVFYSFVSIFRRCNTFSIFYCFVFVVGAVVFLLGETNKRQQIHKISPEV